MESLSTSLIQPDTELATKRADRIARIVSLTINSMASNDSRAAYNVALTRFQEWLDGRPLTIEMLSEYRAALLSATFERAGRPVEYSAATINQHLAALRRFIQKAADLDQSIAPILPQLLRTLASVPADRGQKGQWAGKAEAEALLRSPEISKLIGLRDAALLMVALTTGMRRAEIASLRIEQVREIEDEKGQRHWVFAEVMTKKRNIRQILLLPNVKAMLDRWLVAAGIREGAIFRAVSRHGTVSAEPLQPASIYKIVKRYSALAPHDLRRTFAGLLRQAGQSVDKIQIALGHANIATTMRYLERMADLRESAAYALDLAMPEFESGISP
jgi:integrase